jgi:hypothetical protein
MTSLWVRVASARKVGWQEEWSSDIPVSHTLSKCTDMLFANKTFRNIIDSHH